MLLVTGKLDLSICMVMLLIGTRLTWKIREMYSDLGWIFTGLCVSGLVECAIGRNLWVLI